ncbi:MAG: hypothetical protein AAFR53_12580 [Pseudomonadota bacterium]
MRSKCVTSLRAIRAKAQRFVQDRSGFATIEAVLMIPLLFWGFAATFVVFDAYKKQTDALRVSYAVADAISREETSINQAYLDSMVRLSDYMTAAPETITQRVTIVCYSEENTEYHVAWSKTTGGAPDSYTPHDNQSLNVNQDRLPIIPVGDQLIVVETFMGYEPIWQLGFGEQEFDYWIFTRPRFTNQIKWEDNDDWVCPAA